jgi:hypothetical protein
LELLLASQLFFPSLTYFGLFLSADVAADGARSYRKQGDKEASKGDEG